MAKSQKRLKRSNRTPTENIDQSDAKNASAAYEVVLSGAAEAASGPTARIASHQIAHVITAHPVNLAV